MAHVPGAAHPAACLLRSGFACTRMSVAPVSGSRRDGVMGSRLLLPAPPNTQVKETKKIWGTKDVAITATCIRWERASVAQHATTGVCWEPRGGWRPSW